MKIVDLDKLLKNFVKDYVEKTKPDIKGEDLDDVLSDVYKKFDAQTFGELGGKTPANYFDGYKGNYAELIKEHFLSGVRVSDYFISSAVKFAKSEDLCELLNADLDEDIIIPAMEILDKKNCKIAFYRYIDLLFNEKTDGCVVEKIIETLAPYADDVADKILERLNGENETDTRFISILCNCNKKRNGIKKLLLNGFIMGENIPEYCSYAITYGDETILPDLEELIDGENDYVAFKELNIAIEALGGEARSDRDFEGNKDYIKIKERQKEEDDGDKDKN